MENAEDRPPYIIVQSTNVIELVSAVNRLICEGYKPNGGMAVEAPGSFGKIATTYYQPLFRDE